MLGRDRRHSRQIRWEDDMRPTILLAAAALLLPGAAAAPMSNMPERLQQRLPEINPTWGKDITGNVAITAGLYTPLLKAVPRDGIETTPDVAYGPDPRHRVDVFKPAKASGAPVVV